MPKIHFPVKRCEGGTVLGRAITKQHAIAIWKEETIAGQQGRPCRAEFDEDAQCWYVYEAETANVSE